LFTVKGNLVFMNNLYHKVAVASVCTALSFTLGASKEAKAATLTLTGTTFVVEGNWSRYGSVGERIFDSEGYPSSNGITLLTDGSFSSRNSPTERRAFYEFNIGNLSLAPNTIISRASLDVAVGAINFSYGRYFYLQIFGYVGNGEPDLSDFDAGIKLGFANALTPLTFPDPYPLPRPRSSIDFDVTEFVKARVSNSDAFAGFGLRIEDFYANYGTATLVNPRLTIETADVAEPVPEPTTIFGSAIGLGLGGWLKRKNSSRQNKTTPQH
jgi:hypothetical protein